jgi:hypothetical protein
MDAIKIERIGKHLNILEKHHKYKISKDRLHMNDIYIDTYNPIFETLNQIAAHTPQSPI